MAANELELDPSLSQFTGGFEELPDFLAAMGVEIKAVREEDRLVDGVVPFDLIDNEEVPVHEEYTESLATNMNQLAEKAGGSGQRTAVNLGLILQEPKLRIADGFHRSAARRKRGDDSVFGSVELTDWDRLYDYRIYTAKEHKHVRFSRVVQWIREIWTRTEMSEHMTVEQAVLLYEFELPGSRLGLDPIDVTAAKAWVARKEEQWQIDAMTLREYLTVAEHVDPQLVHSTREKVDSHTLTAPTQSILKVFSKNLPDDFDRQNMVMAAAMSHNLRAPQVKALCIGINTLETLEEAEAFINGINWETWQPEYSDGTKRAMRRAHDPRFKGALVLQRADTEIDTVTERVELSIKRGEEVTDEMVPNLSAARGKVNNLIQDLGILNHKLIELERRKTAARPENPARAQRPEAPIIPRAKVARPSVPPPKPAAPKASAPKPIAKPPEPAPRTSKVKAPRPDPTITPKPAKPVAPRSTHQRVVLERDSSFSATITERPTAVPESDATKAAKAKLRNFLNGRSEEMPAIESRLDIVRAERLLQDETFSGDPVLQEEIREAIRDARKNL